MSVALDGAICEGYFVSGAHVAVALSGGADSVCLCSLMSKLASEKGFNLTALHLNHMIRGDEADRDERFCYELCKRLSIRLVARRENVPELARLRGQSLEEAAREARYSFFEDVMRAEGISTVATAHNADDNAETVLYRLIRGASLDGICGIRSERELSSDMMIVRPILAASKREILAYCAENGLDYVTDSTNSCTDFPRNRIRASILPEAEAINPSFLSVNARNCEQFSIDADFIGCEANALYAKACSDGRLSVSELMGKHRAITSRIVSRLCCECGASPERKHVSMLCDAIEKGDRMSLSIPGHMRAVISDGYMYVCPDTRRKHNGYAQPHGYSLALSMGENEYRNGTLAVRISLELTDRSDKNTEVEEYSEDSNFIYTLSTCKTFNFDTIKGNLFARSRLPGDCINFGSFHKDIRRALSEKRIPKPLRDVIPVICDGDGVMYVPTVGCRIGSTDNGSRYLSVRITLSIDAENVGSKV